MSKITILDVKSALKDSRFRLTLPKEYEKDIDEYLKNPNCPCHVPLYKKIIKECKEQLERYYPGREISSIQEEVSRIAENQWQVINCHIDELEPNLRKLGPGRKQISMARYEDQITIVVNHLDIVF
jgi:hypothetical protein